MYENGIKERANKIVKKYLEYKSICWKIALCWVPYFALYKIKAIRNILEYILLMFVPNIDTIEVVNIYFIINNIYTIAFFFRSPRYKFIIFKNRNIT